MRYVGIFLVGLSRGRKFGGGKGFVGIVEEVV